MTIRLLFLSKCDHSQYLIFCVQCFWDMSNVNISEAEKPSRTLQGISALNLLTLLADPFMSGNSWLGSPISLFISCIRLRAEKDCRCTITNLRAFPCLDWKWTVRFITMLYGKILHYILFNSIIPPIKPFYEC